MEDLSIKATRAIYALNSKIRLTKLPINLSLKLFHTLITPILLYGSDVWGPFLDLGFKEWDQTNIEQVHIQLIKRILGCNLKTSNIMSRGEVGERPLLTQIIKRTVSYIKNIQTRKDSLVFKAWKFDCNNEISSNGKEIPNFITLKKKKLILTSRI